jgi:hypothetical protein
MTSDRLSSWIAGLRAGGHVPMAEHRAALDEAARQAIAGVPADALPLRLPKRRVADLVRCPRLAVASAGAGPAVPSVPLVMGRLAELGAHLVVLGAIDAAVLVSPDDLLRAVESAGRALADPLAAAAERFDDTARANAADDLADRVGQLARSWVRSPARWVRCEERFDVPLATAVGGAPAVVVSGRVDVSFGAPPLLRPAGEPRGVVELKSTRLPLDPIEESAWYALLAGLVEGVAPDGTALWAPDEGGPNSVGRLAAFPVSKASIVSAASRLEDAMVVAGELAAGAKPAERPGWWCAACPDRAVCPSSEGSDDLAVPDLLELASSLDDQPDGDDDAF